MAGGWGPRRDGPVAAWAEAWASILGMPLVLSSAQALRRRSGARRARTPLGKPRLAEFDVAVVVTEDEHAAGRNCAGRRYVLAGSSPSRSTSKRRGFGGRQKHGQPSIVGYVLRELTLQGLVRDRHSGPPVQQPLHTTSEITTSNLRPYKPVEAYCS